MFKPKKNNQDNILENNDMQEFTLNAPGNINVEKENDSSSSHAQEDGQIKSQTNIVSTSSQKEIKNYINNGEAGKVTELFNNYPSTKKYLSHSDRTNHIKDSIDHAYNKLKHHPEPYWHLFNGDYDEYNFMMGIYENFLIKQLIQKAPDQKSFYILDFGAGNFQFCRYQAFKIKQLVAENEIRSDIIVNFISVRGEYNKENPIKNEANCNLYEFGNFKIENFADELKAKNLGSFSFDFVFSNYTLMHLVDPLGTFLQLHNAVREGGLLLIDGLHFGLEDSEMNIPYSVSYLTSALKDSGDYILVTPGKIREQVLKIAIEKHSDNIKLNLEYDSTFLTDDCKSKTAFTFIDDKEKFEFNNSINYIMNGGINQKLYFGSPKLFTRLLELSIQMDDERLKSLLSDDELDVEYIKYVENVIKEKKAYIENDQKTSHNFSDGIEFLDTYTPQDDMNKKTIGHISEIFLSNNI